MAKFLRSAAFPILIVVLLAFFVMQIVNNRDSGNNTMVFGDFVQKVKDHDVKSVDVNQKDHNLTVVLNDSDNKITVGYTDDYPLTQLLVDNSVSTTIEGTGSSMWSSLLISALPILIIVIFWIFLMNQMQGGGNKVMSFGKSRAKRMSVDQPKVTFGDVAGVEEAVEELQEIKEFLENPRKFQNLGAKIPKGVLLYGPPGTGKTLLARAVAGEAGVPFFSISGSDFVEMFVGVGASRVRDLFEQAKQNAPCIIFIDEIDAVGRHRGAGLGGGHDEREQTLNQLLVEMDGFEMKDNVIMIAATNRPDILDPALLRPGRFDRQIVVDRPDRKGREAILKVHSRGKPLGKDIKLGPLAGQTPGFTGADLANLVNEAALLAARHGKKEIGMEELEEGIMRVVAGPEKKSRILSGKEKLITAYHEVGHAMVGHFLPYADPIHKVSVISRGQALGYTISLPQEDRFLVSKSELLDRLASTLGGRAAEEIQFNEVTSGAANDLQQATEIAKQMIMRYGMSERLGPRTFGHNHAQPFLGREFSQEPDYSNEIAQEIDEEIRTIIEDAHVRAVDILNLHREQLDQITNILVDRETLEKEEFDKLLDGMDVVEVFAKKDADRAAKEKLEEHKRLGGIKKREKEPSEGSGIAKPKEPPLEPSYMEVREPGSDAGSGASPSNGPHF